MNIWFTADYHLSHANIIKYCNRPFKTLEDMNNTIIRNHNERIKSEDTLYFLGDFCFRNSPGGKKGEGEILRAEYYKKLLNGNIVFIKGNHDANNSLKTHLDKAIIFYGQKSISLTHRPEHVDTRCDLHFVGHVHQIWKFKRIKQSEHIIDLMNVGVDVWGFKPVSFDEIMRDYHKWKRENKYE